MDKQLRAVLAPFGLRAAIVFGSVAKGCAKQSSDLDIAVLADQPLTASLKIRLIEALALETGRPIDLIDLQEVGEPLLGEIVATGRQILGEASVRGDLLYRHLVNVADFIPLQQQIRDRRRELWLNP